MSDDVYSHVGVTVEVSASVQNEDLNQVQFEALTYVPIANIGLIGEYGLTTNMNVYDGLGTSITTKAKGLSDGGTPELEFARVDDDPGQIIMETIGAPGNFNNYCFRINKQDGAVDYLRGLVSGPASPGGVNEDFDLYLYTLALNQVVYHVPFDAPPLVWIFDTGFLSGTGVVTTDGIIPA